MITSNARKAPTPPDQRAIPNALDKTRAVHPVATKVLGQGDSPVESALRRPECLHQWFEAQVELKPLEVAVVFEKERITYQTLNRRANHVAHRLMASGMVNETLVGIFMDRSVNMIVAMLGVLKAGGAYVPLDPLYPLERLAFMLADTQVGLILAQTSLLDRLESIRAGAKLVPQVYCVDAADAAGAVDELNPDQGVGAANLAYIIYTSGSTGKPKGVAVEHRNSVALVAWASQVYSEQELDGVLAGISISFDPSILDIFMPLCLGGKVILAANTLALPRLEAAEEVRLLFSVPSVVRELLRMGGIPSSVETINMGGEHLPASLVQDLYALPHLKRVYDLYGPTETTT